MRFKSNRDAADGIALCVARATGLVLEGVRWLTKI